MKKWREDLCNLWRNKWYRTAMILTGLCGYGFLITHQTVGIDDTPYSYYFDEGLSAIVGRWFMFLLNKVFHISEFAPFITDLCGVILLMLAASVWCVLFCRILGERLKLWGAVLFSCLFLSNPLISEVFTYYLHNGVATGYLFTGISLCFLWEGLERCQRQAKDLKGQKKKAWLRASLKRNVWSCWAASALGLWIAMGCYESFMIVYLVGVCIVFCTARIRGGELPFPFHVLRSLAVAAVIAVAGMILRSLMIAAVTGVFGLEHLRDEAVQRSVTEMAAWLREPDAPSVFGMILKRIFVMYGAFAYAYYPIFIYVLAAAAAFVSGIWWSVRRRDGWILVLLAGSVIASYLLVIIEGKATYYRSAQFLPLFSAWGLLLVIYAVNGMKKWANVILCALLCIILWNQCTDLNRWFYVDWMKYENAVETMNRVAYELEKSYDISKPVIFTGTYEPPRSIVEAAYIPYNSETHYKLLHLTCLLDEHLLEKFYRTYGIWVAQTPALSVIDWGRHAFDTDQELIKFLSMHGHEFQVLWDKSLYDEAESIAVGWPSFPQEGSIADMGDYIIVHF